MFFWFVPGICPVFFRCFSRVFLILFQCFSSVFVPVFVRRFSSVFRRISCVFCSDVFPAFVVRVSDVFVTVRSGVFFSGVFPVLFQCVFGCFFESVSSIFLVMSRCCPCVSKNLYVEKKPKPPKDNYLRIGVSLTKL